MYVIWVDVSVFIYAVKYTLEGLWFVKFLILKDLVHSIVTRVTFFSCRFSEKSSVTNRIFWKLIGILR